MSLIRSLLYTFLLYFASFVPAWAIIPENGVWWAPSLDGSGFNLEVQDNILVFASYGYDENGNPAWYIAAGAMTSDRNFTAPVQRYSAGSCLNCPYRKPTGTVIGNLTITFTSSQTANFSLLGATIPVERFDFIGRMKSKPDTLLSEWSMVTGDSSFPVYFSDRIQLYAKISGGLGGNRLGSTARLAVAQVNPDGSMAILVDSSTSYYDFYIFNTTGFNRLEGSTWTYLKTSTPTGNGTFFQGFRTASYAYLTSGRGPASSKSALAATGSEEAAAAQRALAYKAAKLDGTQATADVVSIAEELAGKLKDMAEAAAR